MLFCLISISVDYDADNTISSSPSDTHAAPRYYSQLKKAHKIRTLPELREEDLEEAFVRGTAHKYCATILVLTAA